MEFCFFLFWLNKNYTDKNSESKSNVFNCLYFNEQPSPSGDINFMRENSISSIYLRGSVKQQKQQQQFIKVLPYIYKALPIQT